MGTTAVGYLGDILPLSNWVGREDEKFYHGWTVFYWAWWISWSPFVGMLSAQTGLHRGIKYLSNLNMVLTLSLMGFLLFLGPTDRIGVKSLVN